jgi:hypothetical protein
VTVLWLRAFSVCEVVDTMLTKKQKQIDNVLGEEGASTVKSNGGSGVSASAVLDRLFAKPAQVSVARLFAKPAARQTPAQGTDTVRSLLPSAICRAVTHNCRAMLDRSRIISSC